jgi:hypothetical protein
MRLLLLALPLLAATACKPAPEAPPAAPATAEGDGLTGAERALVEAACAQCHALPPPDSLPKGAMIDQVHGMFGLSATEGMPSPDIATIALAERYYAARSPTALPRVAQSAGLSTRLRFRAEAYSPGVYQQNPIPATSNVQFANLWHRQLKDVLFTEMRSRSVLWVSPWQAPAQRQVLTVQIEMNYPVQAHPVDMNGDGLQDLLVAGIGDMNRDNSRKGSVSLLLRQADGPWKPFLVAERLARAVAVRPLDADGDGDLDLVVAAFGWMGPGELLLFENRTTDWAAPLFLPRQLDDRDGFIRIETADLNEDGREDFVAVIAQEHEQVVAFLNRGDLSFEKKVLYQGLHPAWGTSGLQLLDFDGDGDTDALVSNGDTLDDNQLKPYHGVRWLENRGGLDFVSHWIGTCYGCSQAVAGDLDGDGDLDVVGASWLSQLPPATWKNKDLDSVVWFESNGGSWTRHAIEKHANYHPTVAVGDHDLDGKLDVVVGNWTWIGGDGAAVFGAPAITLYTQQ